MTCLSIDMYLSKHFKGILVTNLTHVNKVCHLWERCQIASLPRALQVLTFKTHKRH